MFTVQKVIHKGQSSWRDLWQAEHALGASQKWELYYEIIDRVVRDNNFERWYILFFVFSYKVEINFMTDVMTAF